MGCCYKSEKTKYYSNINLQGAWKLLKGTLLENGKSTITNYNNGISFIKIINKSHFAFLQHNNNKNDSSASFAAGGGSYTLKDSSYTEHLQYCSAREWEGKDFTFTISINNDTLIQKGIEKVEGTNINRYNAEIYVRGN